MKRKPTAKAKKSKKVTLVASKILKVPITQGPTGFDKVLHFTVTTFFCFLRYLGVFLLGFLCALTVICVVVGIMYARSISKTSDIPVTRLFSIALQSRTSRPLTQMPRQTFVILGTDALVNRDEQSKLTDTIMVISASADQGKIDTFSIPRDLWIASQSTKINGLYAKDASLPQDMIQGMTGVQIQGKIVIDIATVAHLIDALGGLDVTVERSFVDYKFPRSDVDVRTEHDFNKLYETVAFTKGVEHMSGDRALRYIRSRHSLDPVEGSDDARVKRQQQVMLALIAKLKDPLLVRNPEQIGKLLHMYTTEIDSTVSLEDMSAIGWKFVKRKQFPVFVAHQFTIKEVDAKGMFTHPDRFPGGAWVYLPVDPTYAQMKSVVSTWLAN